MLDEMKFLQPNTCYALILFDVEMCHLGFMTGVGIFGGFFFCPVANKNSFLHG